MSIMQHLPEERQFEVLHRRVYGELDPIFDEHKVSWWGPLYNKHLLNSCTCTATAHGLCCSLCALEVCTAAAVAHTPSRLFWLVWEAAPRLRVGMA